MPENVSVLHVVQPTDGGVPLYVAQLLADQKSRGWNVAVATPPQSASRPLFEASDGEVLAWRTVRSPGPTSARETAALRRIITSRDPTIVHLHSAKAGLAGRLAVRGSRPTVFQPHGWSFYAARGPVKLAAVAWERYAARWADALVCVSEHERRAGEEHGIAGGWRIIPNGVDVDLLQPATTHEREVARRMLGLPDAPIAVCVGRLSYAKGQDFLLRCWRCISSQLPHAKLVLVGTGEDEEKLRRRAPPSVYFAGLRPDVTDWLAAATVVVIPSRWEGMSLAMLEAMARARSIVSTDVGGAREALSNGAGAVIDQGDLTAFSRAVCVRLADPVLSDNEGCEGRRRVETQYELRSTMPAIADLYQEIIAGRMSAVQNPSD